MPAAYLKAMHIQVPRPGRCRKVPYTTRAEARVAKQAMYRLKSAQDTIEHGQGLLSIYRCPMCPYWHLGHDGIVDRKKVAPS